MCSSLQCILKMIRVRKVTLFYVLLCCLQLCLVSCQRYGYPSGYQNQNYGQTYSLPVQYVPAQSPICQNCGNLPLPINSPVPNVAYNYPGEAEVRELQSAYPNQPVIIINNGGYGDTGRDRKDDDFDIGELLTLMLAVNGGGALSGGAQHHHHHHPKAPAPAQESQSEPYQPDPYPSYPPMYPGYPYGYPYFQGYPGMPELPKNPEEKDGGAKNERGPGRTSRPTTVTNITIVLPSLSSTSVEISSKDKDEGVKDRNKKEEKQEDDDKDK